MDLVQEGLDKWLKEPQRWGRWRGATGDLLLLTVGLMPMPVFGSRRAVQWGQHGGLAD